MPGSRDAGVPARCASRRSSDSGRPADAGACACHRRAAPEGRIAHLWSGGAGDDRAPGTRTLAGGVVEVDRAQILSLEPAIGRVVAGQFWRADSNATRLLFAPTGRSLKKGSGYIGVYQFLLPFVQVGVTDSLSIGAGTPLIFFGDEASRPVWVTPKYQFFRGSKTSAAVGLMHFVIFGENSRAGLAYAVTTTGSDDNALSVGAGWACNSRYREDDYSSCDVGPLSTFGCTPGADDEGRRFSGPDGWRATPRAPAPEGDHGELRLQGGWHRGDRRALRWGGHFRRSRRLRAHHGRGRARAGADCQLRVDLWAVAFARASRAPLVAANANAFQSDSLPNSSKLWRYWRRLPV